MLTHIVRHIFRTARPTNFKVGIPMEDDNPHQPQTPWPPRSKVKVARSRDQSEPSWPNDKPVSLEAGGGIPCRPKPAATLLVIIVIIINCVCELLVSVSVNVIVYSVISSVFAFRWCRPVFKPLSSASFHVCTAAAEHVRLLCSV